MKKSLLIIFWVFFSAQIFAQKNNQSVEATIIGFFNGLSLVNEDTVRYYSTADFELLEDGEVWNMDTLLNRIMPRRGSNVTRVNSFRFITTTISGNMAWVSYHNTADFSMGEKKRQVRWLESAVLIKSKGRWKIQLLHSTKLK